MKCLGPQEALLDDFKFQQLDQLLHRTGLFTQFLSEQMQEIGKQTEEEAQKAGGKRKAAGAAGGAGSKGGARKRGRRAGGKSQASAAEEEEDEQEEEAVRGGDPLPLHYLLLILSLPRLPPNSSPTIRITAESTACPLLR